MEVVIYPVCVGRTKIVVKSSKQRNDMSLRTYDACSGRIKQCFLAPESLKLEPISPFSVLSFLEFLSRIFWHLQRRDIDNCV
jgi:hypothetical protein